MYHHKFDATGAVPISNAALVGEASHPQLKGTARLYAVLLVLGLPLILLWLLARFAWNDVKAVGRAFAIFYRAAAEELSRP